MAMKPKFGTGYSLSMSIDDQVARLEIRCGEPITWRMLINRLRDLANQLEEDHNRDREEAYQ